MKKFIGFILIFMAHSCIPLQIAPSIKGEKLVKAKKFKKNLPNFYSFIFEDTKNADEFYNFVNTKYNLKHNNVESNVPIIINNTTYYLSFYEREKSTKTLNLIPLAIDMKRTDNGNDPMLEDMYISINGYWYLILTVADSDLKDCLKPNYPRHEEILSHLKSLRDEYFTTSNYMAAFLKMKQ
ncbi:hypothetical protein SAMN05444396_101114 [Flavobacterium segetis]|uniref:Uncharacterized protein n=1 Tax=Flavobacterium segetis TaxID=271157 RepID=A0A1M5E262_9FLAO|nr:hypothetical protein [Flavobacterium segetis]SHF73250.1 hypothetical protein SAMN05444396_101114 [Flavobacterium segetis]